MTLFHTFEPIFDSDSQILILGSFPSVKSRDEGFYYGHPRNRFWQVISSLFTCKIPTTISEKKALLLENRVALWDVCASCEVEASSDASIRNVIPNDIGIILSAAHIKAIYTNGKTAYRLYRKHILPKTRIEPVCLPSTSPANAAISLTRLIDEWRENIFSEDIT
jgi:TDG/mug DNA glycosylase family protein